MDKRFFELSKSSIEAFIESLDKSLPLTEALTHSLLPLGKLFRPSLVFSQASAFDLEVEEAADFAVAIQLVHVASLVHDDLPALDDDSLRRGREATHIAFGEATGVLLADYLNGLALDLVLSSKFGTHEAKILQGRILARSISDVALGQVLDMQGLEASEDTATKRMSLLYRYQLKTASLVSASLKGGALLAGVELFKKEETKLDTISSCLGALFQIRDDLKSATQPPELLGKGGDSDLTRELETLVSMHSAEEMLTMLNSFELEAAQTIEAMGYQNSFLGEVVENLSDDCRRLLTKAK